MQSISGQASGRLDPVSLWLNEAKQGVFKVGSRDSKETLRRLPRVNIFKTDQIHAVRMCDYLS